MKLRPLLTMLVAVAAVVVASTSCAEAEGPAAKVFLQILKADNSIDTTEVTGFVVIVGTTRNVVPFDPLDTTDLALAAPPEAGTPFVVYACETRNAACREADAAFVGCTVDDLVEGNNVVAVGLRAISPVPRECLGVPGAPVEPAG
ncbi:MAG TPA: hypothetical protein VGF99_14905 [Myxococcota bacterium]